jgi:hypothetical protein
MRFGGLLLAPVLLLASCAHTSELAADPRLRKLSGNREMPSEYIRQQLTDEGVALLWDREVTAYLQVKADIHENRLKVRGIRTGWPREDVLAWVTEDIDGTYYQGISTGSRIDEKTLVHVLLYDLPDATFLFMVPKDEGSTSRLQGSRSRLFVVRVFDEQSKQFVYGRVLKPYLGIPLDLVSDRRPSNTRNPPRDPR